MSDDIRVQNKYGHINEEIKPKNTKMLLIYIWASIIIIAVVFLVGFFIDQKLAVLTLLFGLFSCLIIYEIQARRKWEKLIVNDNKELHEEFARLVRDVAKNRNDLILLKNGLMNVGTAAQDIGNSRGVNNEEKILKLISTQLKELGAGNKIENLGLMANTSNLDRFEKQEVINFVDNNKDINELSDETILALVNEAIKLDRIELFAQPVVNLPQRKQRFVELFSRICLKPEVYLKAEKYIEIAKDKNKIVALDNLLLLRGLQLVRDKGSDDINRAYFCNIASQTLNDPKFMGDLVEFIAQNKNLAIKLIFEMNIEDLKNMDEDLTMVLDGLSKLGCRFSVEKLDNMRLDYNLLKARHIRFIKVNAEILIDEMNETGGVRRLKRIKSELDEAGIDLIVSKIETEDELLELLDLEVDYGQGYLFGRPELSEEV